jgi:hypothetical protein
MATSPDDLKNKIEALVQSINGCISDSNILAKIQNLYNDTMDTCKFYFCRKFLKILKNNIVLELFSFNL